MKYAHLAKLTVFCSESEDENIVLNSLMGFFPFNLEQSKIPVKKTSAEGFSKKEIKIFEVNISRHSLLNQFLENLKDRMTELQKGILLKQGGSRLDSNLDFFIRFDKDAWLKEKKLILTDSGNCFHLKISIAAFPKKREVALKVIENLLK